MPRISFTYFGRGTSAASSRITTAYNNLQTLINTTKLSDDNVAEDAGLWENWFVFDASDYGHSHSDGSLGDSVVGHPQLDIDSLPANGGTEARRVEWVLSACPGTMALQGAEMLRGINNYEMTIPFSASYDRQSGFPEGTIPIVMTTLGYTNATKLLGSGQYARIIVEEVTNVDFTCKLQISSGFTNATLTLWYFAIGVAPGFITNIGGV